jgi:hypothetical protein
MTEPLDEALRMRQCPGIYFADEPSVRTAKIGGIGLSLRAFTRDKNPARIRKAFPQLLQAQVTAALMYYSRYRDEVQAIIDANAALTPEAIESIRGWCASIGEGQFPPPPARMGRDFEARTIDTVGVP